ncbi:hypothetical protein LX64_02587 [Chitinophaga skermanii]|uniref:Uncharacterized protein n=1 Tax=Chitinophaga skermanii TaxID=331697 RepID=A0A327QLK7_9BACT|nr:hypothetical protein [Chitinophaga skermanii]RAJ05429.1 hypothetical protein LX64_02587 [Chitinophaga skermanii]
MDVKYFPSAVWKLSSRLSVDKITQVVEASTEKKTWKFSLKSAFAPDAFTSKITQSGFELAPGKYGMSYTKSSLLPPAKVKLSIEGNFTVLNCEVTFNGRAFSIIGVFYGVLMVISFLGFSNQKWPLGIFPILIGLIHYTATIINFNRLLFRYDKFMKELLIHNA